MEKERLSEKNYCRLISLWAIFLSCPAVFAQHLDLRLDYARYNYNDQSSLLEIYYSFDASSLALRSSADRGDVREAVFELRIFRDDSLWAADAWRTMLPAAPKKKDQADDRRVELLRYVVTPGGYRVQLTAKDLGSQAGQEAVLDLRIDPISPTDLWMSDIELAANIRKEDPDSTERMFYKNQFVVIPQTDRTYADQRPMLYYYAEIYNLQENMPESTYKVNSYVSDMQGNPIPGVRGRMVTKPKTMDASVEVGSLHLGMLPAGDYLLNVEALSGEKRLLAKRTKPFVMMASPPAASLFQEIYMARYAAMSDKELEIEFKQTAYLLSSEGREVYQQLDNSEARRRFLAEFWLSRDPTPSTAGNEFYDEYRERTKYANENLRSFARQGWQTDRGRVYMVYGRPTDIEFFPSTESNRPYERWQYDNVDGGVEFIFVDRTGFKEYRLVHSTKIGEIKDPDWAKQLAN
jgi:GWxTD domain-containing protein